MFVDADIFADGHDIVLARLLYRHERETAWKETVMEPLGNDKWAGSFPTKRSGNYVFTITAWVDPFQTWRMDFRKRVAADQPDVPLYLQIGTQMVAEAATRANAADRARMEAWAAALSSKRKRVRSGINLILREDIDRLMQKYADRHLATTYHREVVVTAEREKAGFSTWYEMFPRSASPEPGRHGTFRDCEAKLPYIAGMGFDVLYFPPIHPIGVTARKGKNNAVNAASGDPGTPWAIGSAEGGHKSIHPQLGTLKDFRSLMKKAAEYDIEIALDIAFQCSPDHPYVKEHPEWFSWRPDGTIQYAENPPKKYQDIYPFNFETEHWQELWEELKSVVIYWARQGVRIFRVDNPHTKPFAFWEWLIAGVKKEYPETIFLAEAFTRPRIMYRLAKLGFTQSYTYFTWRNTKTEITEYLRELTQTEVRDFFRPNFWPNTPDILHEYLQTGGRPAFISRLILAATLSSNYGIYGPAFELMENTPREPGSEEYLNSEKYELKHWDTAGRDSLKDLITRVNTMRRENPALQSNRNLWFNATDNEKIICYSKHTDDLSNIVMVVVNLDPSRVQNGWVNAPLAAWKFEAGHAVNVHELLTGSRSVWHQEWNHVELNPHDCPVRIYRVAPEKATVKSTGTSAPVKKVKLR